ncbi:uncharacterized protein LOC112184623 [Rosa chinensis]|uniref:uncharacterized protein LOC112184623 n=1 Tax=Rosa chinensis TaxID=74649 RepID=UPI000D096E69|nr:uncharacterized protein LOC112184623 [Rosa chinensis]
MDVYLLGSSQEWFKAGCKSIIGLDRAHLKGPFGGQLLIAVAVDANNTSWVVAYAMVEMETKDARIWFMELLVKDLDNQHEGRGWVFISDKQKGLIPAFEEVVQRAHIRFCVRHMWTNFTKHFLGKVMKDQMWAYAKATTLPYFKKEMNEMKSLDNDAYKWMTEFQGLDIRCSGQTPVTLFEELRVKLMRWIAVRKEKMEGYHGNIYPKPKAIIERNRKKVVVNCIATFNGGNIAEVDNIEGSKNVVKLAMRTCTCRRWDLTGIPCKHAISAIYMKREDPDTLNRKRKNSNEEGQTSENQHPRDLLDIGVVTWLLLVSYLLKSKKAKKQSMTNNELRQKAKERVEYKG